MLTSGQWPQIHSATCLPKTGLDELIEPLHQIAEQSTMHEDGDHQWSLML